jgi:hypothetical protein
VTSLDSLFSPNLSDVEKEKGPILDANSTGESGGEVSAYSEIQAAFSSAPNSIEAESKSNFPLTQKVTATSQREKLMGQLTIGMDHNNKTREELENKTEGKQAVHSNKTVTVMGKKSEGKVGEQNYQE